jgi:hypothetical protein
VTDKTGGILPYRRPRGRLPVGEAPGHGAYTALGLAPPLLDDMWTGDDVPLLSVAGVSPIACLSHLCGNMKTN